MNASRPAPSRPIPPANAERVWCEFLVALDALPPAARAAFLLYAVFEAGYDDIAALIGEPAPACREHVARARAQTLARVAALYAREGAAP
ncbi:hypothetical protein J5226_02320 [Lysobacter sp. K5869]|uniref:sigma factor-like helix-turn-helix DNA-binding protein n=1 Tax=Lysobacter sp. K5869 TaxID=2820808 RepID=UPI001C05F087|nr:sigma factor-like helix-turn-helix DNA-binding protein [Lysobacter sp. K5869]QWP77263.1 hypothetical protein J5226_02320 [Lysobacter sp. K5869]